MNPEQNLERLARFPLAHLPTPLEPLARLSKALGGPRLYIKRDDCTGLALGGNKTRKLEFLIGEALANGATTVITEGGVQSNHVRQSAAAAVRAGLECILVLDDAVGWPDWKASLSTRCIPVKPWRPSLTRCAAGALARIKRWSSSTPVVFRHCSRTPENSAKNRS